ncbi:MAG: hypothetical protein GXY79_08445 [Chloroflexi bacterium]|nr:hypothetical protein [Chloroflexota bacterium]
MVPTQLYARLPALEALSFRASIAEAKPQGDVVSQSDTLVEDVMAEVVQLRRQPLRLPADIEFHPQIANRLALGARMRGPASPKRLHLLWRVLCNQELVQHGGKQWHVTLQTRRWLGQSDGEQWLACFLAWRNDRSWDELYDLEAIACDRRACPNEPWAARQRLCGMLLDLIGPWYDLDSFIAAVRQHHPDYLRPDGDMDSWVIRDAASGEFIRGMGDWDRVEGALLKELISGPLHWLGIIDLAQDRDGRPILRDSEHGAELLAEMPPHTDTPPAAEPIATLDSHLFLSARTGQSRYQRYQVERLAVWQEQDAQQAHYRLTEDSIWQALNAGITHEQILSFLQRITGHGVPEIATRLLDAWGRRFGAVSLRRVVLLEARDAATMRQIRQQLGSTHLLGTVLDATRCLVDEDNMEPLVAALKRRGMWPRITRPEQKTGGS